MPVCRDWHPDGTCCADRYWCGGAGEDECATHGGFDVCCDRPQEHRPLGEVCAARAALTRFGVTGCWAGMDTPVSGPVLVSVWRADGRMQVAAAAEDAAPIEDVAAWLAEKSGSPRYAGGQQWRKLLDAEANVTHAFRCAEARREVPPERLGAWRDRLTAWHRQRADSARHAQSGP